MFTGIHLYGLIGVGLPFALLLAWALRLDHLLGSWADKYATLSEQADEVLFSAREASDNPNLEWRQAAGLIYAIGESDRQFKIAISQ